ncbi:hypothetical protein BKA67DRAFT_529722 [Truncatella angustata]|uniref:Uncharacterized protein n=1 Tax=Truncatella angustata TaxID=152316 RepID=A0A9P8UX54_9PEZI|nr:uncharacterized protein BKA67DRAFT_529722 [Truncatella angustata]KAH6659579.1 hypothetical protein BKA67DRAFT_529722 [Truncatella angustata]
MAFIVHSSHIVSMDERFMVGVKAYLKAIEAKGIATQTSYMGVLMYSDDPMQCQPANEGLECLLGEEGTGFFLPREVGTVFGLVRHGFPFASDYGELVRRNDRMPVPQGTGTGKKAAATPIEVQASLIAAIEYFLYNLVSFFNFILVFEPLSCVDEEFEPAEV